VYTLTDDGCIRHDHQKQFIVCRLQKFHRITPVLHQLHWLPVRQRITFKLAMITFKCLRGLAPSYVADVCIPVLSVVGRWQLQSADSGTLVVPRTRTTIGRRDFAVSGPATGNSLPVELQTSSLSSRTFAKIIYSSASASEAFCLTGAIYVYIRIHSFIQNKNNDIIVVGAVPVLLPAQVIRGGAV